MNLLGGARSKIRRLGCRLSRKSSGFGLMNRRVKRQIIIAVSILIGIFVFFALLAQYA